MFVVAWPIRSVVSQAPSPAGDRLRISEILGIPVPATERGTGVFPVAPDIRFVWNSTIPFSLNDGSLWAGRGVNIEATFGALAVERFGEFRLDVAFAPTLDASQNRPFEIAAAGDPTRSTFSSPWHFGSQSADLPLRFGTSRLLYLNSGRSSAALSFRNVSAGVTSAEDWWGPAIRNTLVLSNNAGGVPRAFVRVILPPASPIGSFDAQLIAGTLTKSLFFDTVQAHDFRAVSGVRLSWKPPWSPNLTVGFARAVHSPVIHAGDAVGRAVDVLTVWQDSAHHRVDQISSLFGRWVMPDAGLEVYGEWARDALPRTLTGLFDDPHHGQGYTIGGQWVVPTATRDQFFRLQAEVTDLEQSASGGNVPASDFYSGSADPAGYTQRGQVLGAAIGPGASSQFIGFDVVRRKGMAGLFVGRIRWENDALYRQRFATDFSHDVTVFAGVRATRSFDAVDGSIELTAGHRQNYLFQNGFANPGGAGTVNVNNTTLAIRISPREIY